MRRATACTSCSKAMDTAALLVSGSLGLKVGALVRRLMTARPPAITFDIEPVRAEDRHDWYEEHTTGAGHRLLVAEDGGRIVGYAGTGTFRGKRAYDTTVAGEPVHRAVAGITLPNVASIALHRRFGFEEVGVFRENGRKLGRYW